MRWCAFVFYCCRNKFSGLKHPTFILLQFGRLEIQHRTHWAKTNVLAGLHYFLEYLGENMFPHLFQILGSVHVSWLMILIPIYHLQNQQLCISLNIPLVRCPRDHSQERVSVLNDSYNYFGPTWIVQNNLPISRF